MSENRGEWNSHFEYFLTSLGIAVGLGNVWRFPYVCYDNGGGTFLIPYGICLLLCGLPLYFMEMVLGQYGGSSCTKVFPKLAPVMKGLGYAVLAVPTMMIFYYTLIMAWSFYYMFHGFRSELPWQSCNSQELANVSTMFCYSKHDNDLCLQNFSNQSTFFGNTCMDKAEFCQVNGYSGYNAEKDSCVTATNNLTSIPSVARRVTPSEEFFNRRMYGQVEIGEVDTWESWGEPLWEMIGCLALSWLIIALSLVKGVQSYGKLSYFITLFPYLIMTTFLITMGLQPGFSRGITDFYMKAEWERLTHAHVWVAACTQIFYSLGVGVGCQLLLCSYNPFNNNCHRDAWLIAVGNSLTSVYAGFVVFGTLGVLAENNGVPVEDVITHGVGLTFQVYPEAISLMPVPPLFSFLFFFMLCLLARSSIVGMMEPTVAAVLDEFPSLRKGSRRSLVYLVSCFVAFLGGLSMCFPSGIFMFNIINDHSASTVLYMSFFELVVVSYIYGIKNFLRNIEDMKIWMPTVLKYFWTLCWVVVTPAIVLVITVVGFTDRHLDSLDGYTYPDGAQALAYMLELSPVLLVLLVAIPIIVTRVRRGEAASLFSSEAWVPRQDNTLPDIGLVNRTFEDTQIGTEDVESNSEDSIKTIDQSEKDNKVGSSIENE